MLKKQQGFLDVVLLAALFSPSFMFIKIALRDIEPITLIALRIGISGLLLLLTLRLRNISLPRDLSLWKYCFILGFFINGFPFICFSYSLTTIPTSLSALINGLAPVMTVFLANAFLEDERLTWNRVLGVILGLFGFAVLFLPALLGSQMEFDVVGILLSFAGSCSYAVGAVYARKCVKKAPPLVAPTLQLLSSMIYLIPLSFIFETPMDLVNVTFSSWAAVMGVSLLGTTLAFIMYHRIIHLYGATAVAMAMYLLPIFGTLLGVVFLSETITVSFAIAALLILSGVGVINGIFPLPQVMKKAL